MPRTKTKITIDLIEAVERRAMWNFDLAGLARPLALAGGVAFACLTPIKAAADNLTDALIGAYNTSGLLEQNRALLRAADEDVAVAMAALRPILDWTLTLERQLSDQRLLGLSRDAQNTNLSTGLRLEQLLFDGGASALTKQSAQEQVLAARQTLINVEQSVLLRAVTAYLNLLLQEENVALRQNNVRVLGEELRASQDRFEVGEVTRTDVALSESRLAAARANLADAEGNLVTARAEYVNAVGREPGRTAGQPPTPQLPASLDAAVALAVRNHPTILSEQHRVRAQELNIQVAQANLGPSAFLQAEVFLEDNVGNSDFRNAGTLGVEMRQRLYNGGRNSALVRRAMAQRDASRANLLNLQKDVVQDVKNAYTDYLTAGSNLTATNERTRAAQVAFDGIREEATLGARTTLDVLTAEQELLDAQTEQIVARAERSLAAYELLSAQGLLTAEQLRLPVQVYDPTLYYNLVKDAPVPMSKRGQELDRVLKALGKN